MSDLRELNEILAAVGAPPVDRLPTDRGSPRRTHVFLCDDVVVKINQQADSNRLRRERNALLFLAGSALRVPRFVADGSSTAGRRWIAMTRLAGRPPHDALRPPEQVSPGLATQMGALTAALHRAPAPPGFGTWTDESPTLEDEVLRRVELLRRMGADAAIVERTELDAVADLIAGNTGVLGSAGGTPVLAHRDLQPRNVLVDGEGTVTALLDFESAGGGDPAEDFSRVGLDWASAGFAAFAAAYRDAGGPMGDGFAERVAFHVAGWGLAVFAYLGEFAPHFIPVARVAVERVERGEVPPV